jgi:Dyp-type peroxidase family
VESLEKVDWHDVQRLVLSGYPELPFAAYIPLRFVSPDDGRLKAWLTKLIGRLTPARTQGSPGTGLKALKRLKDDGSVTPAINMALTRTGLENLGVGKEELSRFSIEFYEGMAPERVGESEACFPRRCNILGDTGENSPQYWQWGGWNANGNIDGLLLLYAATETELEKLTDYEMEQAQMCGVEFLEAVSANKNGGALILKGRLLYKRPGEKFVTEHFGFRDGISQPIIAGTSRELYKSSTFYKSKSTNERRRSPKEARMHVVRPGEFVLGYLNERGTWVSYSSASNSGARHSKATKEGPRDLARNGTYLVFRQLEQDVCAFNQAISMTARLVRGNDCLENREWVAARFIGRKQNGEPLIPPPFGSIVPEEERNDFLYYFEDRFGLSCPLGAHIRRANPRDLVGPDPNTALRLSKMHRIIRRGRPYGKPLQEEAGNKDERRGMLFICLNADIAGQFELIQHSWINNGRFGGLYSETDPLLNYPGEERILTIQRRPTSERVERVASLNQFVTVRGGAYFFLPGIQALRFLAGECNT